jgi:hypothetical protein
MERIVHYELNICGGDFQHVQDCFEAWKREPLVYRQSRPMFEGKQEVRCLTGTMANWPKAFLPGPAVATTPTRSQ